jgi:alpha-L-rhamnosidase
MKGLHPMRFVAMASVAALSLLASASAQVEATVPAKGLVPHYLRCEYHVNPFGIDVAKPRLSWLLDSGQRAQKQTAFQVLVATDPESLRQDKGDLWDSGKVASEDSTAIVYEGKPLASYARCFWKVKVWDKGDTASGWSQPAAWSMGLLDAAGWKAEWIGYDKPRSELKQGDAPLDHARWIWHADDKEASKPKAHRLFLTTLTLPADAQVKKARVVASADDAFKFTLNGSLVAQSNPGNDSWKTVQEVDVTQRLKPGANTVRAEVENATPGPAGLIAMLEVQLADGKTVELDTDANWKTLADPGANWHDREIALDDLPAAAVVGDHGAQPWGKLQQGGLILPPVPYLRTAFTLDKPVRRATLMATALGLCDVYCNGRRLTGARFTPGWTDYTKRVYYRTYDLTGQVRKGENVLGGALAAGWYSGYVGFGGKRDHYGKHPRLAAQLHVEFDDGTATDIVTGPNWKASTGPLLEADFLMGESYDARKELGAWSEPGFDAGKWDAVDAGAEVHPEVQAHPGPPVRVVGTFKAKSTTEPTPGAFVLDLGQNFAGVARLRVQGEPGQKITLRFAERLNPDGTIYTTNLRSARCVDTYICKGGDVETWEPRFTFHGFQYVEVTGLKSAPSEDTITGLALSSDTPVVGSFTCSDPMLNQLHGNIYWTQRSNFIDIPTDCPQRDERLGWTGDAQVYIRTATLNTDVQAFFNKWLVDLADGQRADGQFPMVAPVKVAGDDGGPAWADAGVICPWTVYQVYGDKRVLERQYPSMVKFVEFCKARSTPDLLPPAKYHCFGDWLSINAATPNDVIYEAYFALSTRLTARAARVLGKADDEAKYRALFDQIKAAFNKAYVGPDGRIKGDTQACYVLALAVDLVDGENARKAAEYLVADIEKRDWHLSTGFIGTKDLMLVLAKIGRDDVAYRLLHNDTFPSWGFSIKHGATSIWERWDGWTPEKGFQDPGMNSFAHYSFGAVYQWMVENIGGIRSRGPAYRSVLIEPRLDGKLTSAKTTYRGIRGSIATDWSVTDGTFALGVTIPVNTTATVSIPAAALDEVTEGGRPLKNTEGVGEVRLENGRALISVGSGQYRFASKLPADH